MERESYVESTEKHKHNALHITPEKKKVLKLGILSTKSTRFCCKIKH